MAYGQGEVDDWYGYVPVSPWYGYQNDDDGRLSCDRHSGRYQCDNVAVAVESPLPVYPTPQRQGGSYVRSLRRVIDNSLNQQGT